MRLSRWLGPRPRGADAYNRRVTKQPHEELRDDVVDELDHASEQLIEVRTRLVSLYRDRGEEELLGPPFDLGLRGEPDGFESLLERVVASGGPARPLRQVVRAEQALDHLVEDYKAGALAMTKVGAWRKTVEETHGRLAAALDEAHEWIRGWKPPDASAQGRGQAPDLTLLDRHELLSLPQLAKVLDVHVDTARRHCKEGDFGEVVLRGRRQFVRAEAVKRALGLD